MSIFGVTICKYMYDLSCIEMIRSNAWYYWGSLDRQAYKSWCPAGDHCWVPNCSSSSQWIYGWHGIHLNGYHLKEWCFNMPQLTELRGFDRGVVPKMASSDKSVKMRSNPFFEKMKPSLEPHHHRASAIALSCPVFRYHTRHQADIQTFLERYLRVSSHEVCPISSPLP